MFKKNKKENDIKIKKEESSLKEFIARPVPTEDEVEEFDERIDELNASNFSHEEEFEEREEAIEEGLNGIYRDEKGRIVNVKTLDIKKKRGFVFWFFSFIFISGILAALGYGAYYYFFHAGVGSADVEFKISGPEKVNAGEEFFYTINYKNLSNVPIKNVRIELKYSDDFILLNSTPVAINGNTWVTDSIISRGSEEIKIKGKIINQENSSSLIQGTIFYVPDNFSSEFKKENSFLTEISGVGLRIFSDYLSTVLVGETSEIKYTINTQEKNYINNFNIEIKSPESVAIVDVKPLVKESENKKTGDIQKITISKISDNIWSMGNIGDDSRDFSIMYKVKEKLTDKVDLEIGFYNETLKNEQNLKLFFYNEKISQEVMKSDLNLMLMINGSKSDQPVNFGDTLNYTIAYANKGDESMTDVVVMAVLESNFLERATLIDENGGQEKGNSITWSKVEIPALQEIKSNESGTIDFSLKVSDFNESDLSNDFQIKSYAQYTINQTNQEASVREDNKSNTVVNKINSDLSIDEKVLYFNEDNFPVGTGPLPPKVGQTTSYKIYWVINNNLHELSDVKVETVLPSGVVWNEKERTSVGTIQYDQATGKVVWYIGRLPITVYRADSEFSLIINPTEDDRNKIKVLLSNTTVTATDKETGAIITKKTSTQTTKLEDDSIAKELNNGVVE
jgi:uncharacterized repeat protein (TIGR01451 family)